MRLFVARSSLIFVVFVATLSAFAQNNSNDSTAARRARHLSHGINASEWFAQSNDYSAARLNSYTTKEDITLIKQMGFDHVRLSLDPAIFDCLLTGQNCDRVQVLDSIVSRCLELDLAVIIDIHPTSEFKHSLAVDDAAVARFADLWSAIAHHFRDKDPERVVFEIMNEPEMNDAYRWSAVQQKALLAIRKSAPGHTVIVAGTHWSDIQDLIVMEPYADANVIYNFHFYEPHIFTHQGATWGEYFWRSLSKVPYPATTESLPGTLKPLDEFERWRLTLYGLEHWDKAHIAGEIDFAAQWAKDHHVFLTCNEFGVYRTYSDESSRSAWIDDVRSALEKGNIGWTMWDYRGGFGVVKIENGKRQPDMKILEALGLRPAAK